MSRYFDVHAKRCSWICNKDARRKQTFSHCNALQHTATHCIALQHTAAHCSTLQHTAAHCIALQHTAAHCSTLQHTQTDLCTLCAVCAATAQPAVCCSVSQRVAVCRKEMPVANRHSHTIYCMCRNNSADSVLQRVAVYRNMSRTDIRTLCAVCAATSRPTVCCSVSQCVAVCRSVPHRDVLILCRKQTSAHYVLYAPQQLSRQCVAACCSVSSQYVANRHSYTMCCIAATSRPTVCCSVSQCNAVSRSTSRKATHSHYILRVPHDRSLTRTCSKP